MSQIKYIFSSSDDFVDKIKESIIDFYTFSAESYELIIDIESKINNYVSHFKDNVYYLIEYPYIDKLYRDSYYNYFSSKFKPYHRDSIRVSLFSKQILPQHFRDPIHLESIEKLYLGYFTIRPTFPNVIGRSFISKVACDKDKFVSCRCKTTSNQNGIFFSIDGFPHSSQDKESSQCAEIAIWTIIDYFSNRYSQYMPILPSQILQILNIKADERLLPSEGLTGGQIAYTLKECGFGTKVYSRDAFGDSFLQIMKIYIESGIPFIGMLSNNKHDSDALRHAVVVIGREKILNSSKLNWVKNEFDVYDTSLLDYHFVIMDDNLSPYTLVSDKKPYQDLEIEEFKDFEFHSIIVPLYPKIYVEAVQAKALAMTILKNKYFGYKLTQRSIIRFFLATSKSFKRHISALDSIRIEIKDDLILSAMPKFIWVCEVYSSKKDYFNEVSSGIFILDATEANNNSMDSIIFAANNNNYYCYIETKLVCSSVSISGYKMFKNNLA